MEARNDSFIPIFNLPSSLKRGGGGTNHKITRNLNLLIAIQLAIQTFDQPLHGDLSFDISV
jgi:hypothetical protein